ncbi:hypothetical protein [Cryptosporangium phraense]|uniref:Uncharacterized protein n=1 Tax=Cryptosporangium phraense TaxID=2593070 RepID=A0A545AMC0_9ACTN|nr:hypothetical protein [Cryptosporangium phraense]TQS42457.1 hypothetical protein FL583_24430 [Cryptosporangium phraense]
MSLAPGDLMAHRELRDLLGQLQGNGAFRALLDCLMEKFAEIGLPEVDYSGSLAQREAEFLMTVEASDFESAVIVAMGDLRTALHAAECATPDWPDVHTLTESIRRIQPDLADA